MSKYHVGDVVKIREDLVNGEVYGTQTFIGDDMMECRGEFATITEVVANDAYKMDICKDYIWTDAMFDDNFNAPAIEVPFMKSKQVFDNLSNSITKNKEVDKLTLINQLTNTLINNLDTDTKDIILRYMLLDFFERFIENGNG